MKKIYLKIILLGFLVAFYSCGSSAFNIDIYLTTQGDASLLSYYRDPSNLYSIFITYQSGYKWARDFSGTGQSSVSVPADVLNEPVLIEILVGNAAGEPIIKGSTPGFMIISGGQQIPITLTRI